jgi:excisionase family DNA binding protein
MASNSDLPPVLLRVPEAARLLGVGRSLTYELIAGGELEVVHVGSVMRVPVTAVHEYIERRRSTEPDVGTRQ